MSKIEQYAPEEVVYVTGAPGVGKSTLVQSISKTFENVEIFSYGARMAAHLRRKHADSFTDELRLRGGTDPLVTMNDVRVVDRELVRWACSSRTGCLLLIDTHQVTLEKRGLRFVPFLRDDLLELGLTKIWLLAASSAEVAGRIATDPKGRIIPSLHEADLHAAAQMTVAMNYSCVLGVEMRIINCDHPKSDVLASALSDLLSEPGQSNRAEAI